MPLQHRPHHSVRLALTKDFLHEARRSQTDPCEYRWHRVSNRAAHEPTMLLHIGRPAANVNDAPKRLARYPPLACEVRMDPESRLE
ncbi:hypothetical protein D3C78_1351810 [compost metagenome]